MIQTRQEYITEQYKEFEAEGLQDDFKHFNFDNEYYALVEEHIKAGNTITQEVYNSLTQGQQYHFNKHYNFRADKIKNSYYQKEIEKDRKTNEKDFEEYLLQKQQKQNLKDQKEKQNIIRELNQEIECLQINLFDYSRLSPIGQRNISRYSHECKQTEIKEKIADIRKQIKKIEEGR